MLMASRIAVPLWLLLPLVALALWALAQHFLIPSVRWFFRRRVNEVIQEINTRLKIEIPSFKLTKREVLIDRLFHDRHVQRAALAWQQDSGASKESALRKQINTPARLYRRSMLICTSASVIGVPSGWRNFSTVCAWVIQTIKRWPP